MEKKLTCIICPLGCEISVELNSDNNNEIISISGNTCKRGEEYAYNECTCPKRTLTTTVATADGAVIPVRTNSPIPKESIFECMEIINNLKIVLPISVGDVIISNIAGTGADIIATDSSDIHTGG